MVREWTREAIAAELARRAALVAAGVCPDSGLPLDAHGRCGICDCWGFPIHSLNKPTTGGPME